MHFSCHYLERKSSRSFMHDSSFVLWCGIHLPQVDNQYSDRLSNSTIILTFIVSVSQTNKDFGIIPLFVYFLNLFAETISQLYYLNNTSHVNRLRQKTQVPTKIPPSMLNLDQIPHSRIKSIPATWLCRNRNKWLLVLYTPLIFNRSHLDRVHSNLFSIPIIS